eukprot:5617731-Pleurochrysis_carterae.AAC.3
MATFQRTDASDRALRPQCLRLRQYHQPAERCGIASVLASRHKLYSSALLTGSYGIGNQDPILPLRFSLSSAAKA